MAEINVGRDALFMPVVRAAAIVQREALSRDALQAGHPATAGVGEDAGDSYNANLRAGDGSSGFRRQCSQIVGQHKDLETVFFTQFGELVHPAGGRTAGATLPDRGGGRLALRIGLRL